MQDDDRVQLDGLDPATVARAMASLVEQTAYTAFAHAALNTAPVDVETVARIVTRAWYLSFYGESAGAWQHLARRAFAG
ncbi:MAG: hypothetical protein J4F50_09230 [Acidimicrobiia bacterium]|nr:hypothetical protein [Acidimicrobiia bacterium]